MIIQPPASRQTDRIRVHAIENMHEYAQPVDNEPSMFQPCSPLDRRNVSTATATSPLRLDTAGVFFSIFLFDIDTRCSGPRHVISLVYMYPTVSGKTGFVGE